MKHRMIYIPVLLYWLLFFVFSYSPTQSQNHFREPKKISEHYDVIIVPGVPYKDRHLEVVFKARVLWAKYLFDNNIADNIIFSGGAVYNPYVEGTVMKIYADSLHIPSAHTFSEIRAEHSTENIYYSLLMAKQMGFKSVAVATDHYQAIIIKKFMEKNCPEVKILPIEYKKINLVKDPWQEIKPDAACVENFVSLVKRENRIKRFKGTLGRNITYSECDSVNYQPKKSLLQLAGIGNFR